MESLALKENMVYRFGVQSIKHNAESFTKKPSGVISHCHFLELIPLHLSEPEVVKAQICTDDDFLRYFNEWDTVQLLATKFNSARGMWTVQFKEIVEVSGYKKLVAKQAMAGPSTAQDAPPPAKQDYNDEPAFKPYYNPTVSGTARERALAHAAHLFQMQGEVNVDKVLAAAEKFAEFLQRANDPK